MKTPQSVPPFEKRSQPQGAPSCELDPADEPANVFRIALWIALALVAILGITVGPQLWTRSQHSDKDLSESSDAVLVAEKRLADRRNQQIETARQAPDQNAWRDALSAADSLSSYTDRPRHQDSVQALERRLFDAKLAANDPALRTKIAVIHDLAEKLYFIAGRVDSASDWHDLRTNDTSAAAAYEKACEEAGVQGAKIGKELAALRVALADWKPR